MTSFGRQINFSFPQCLKKQTNKQKTRLINTSDLYYITVNTSLSHRKFVSTNKPVAFRSVHTGVEPPFLLKYIM